MPVFKVDIEKQYGTEFWTNVYYVDAASLTLAHAVAAEIVNAEQEIHLVSVNFTKYRTSDLLPDTDQYISTALNSPGERGFAGDPLPLFNVVRVELSVGIGRPGRKYLRGILCEGDITFNSINGTRGGGIGKFKRFTAAIVCMRHTNVHRLEYRLTSRAKAAAAGRGTDTAKQLRRGSSNRDGGVQLGRINARHG